VQNIFSVKKQKKEYNLLELIPFRNYQFVYNENKKIDVLVPRFNDRFFGKFLQPRLKNPHIKANLDDMGTSVWELMDGQNKVEDIIIKMNEYHSENEENLEERIKVFIQNLYRNNFIKFYQIK